MLSTISDILEDEFCCVYCDTCKYDLGDDECYDCHRKNIGWALSEEESIKVADRIIRALEDM